MYLDHEGNRRGEVNQTRESTLYYRGARGGGRTNAAFMPPRTIQILGKRRPRGPRRVHADAHIDTRRGNQSFRIGWETSDLAKNGLIRMYRPRKCQNKTCLIWKKQLKPCPISKTDVQKVTKLDTNASGPIHVARGKRRSPGAAARPKRRVLKKIPGQLEASFRIFLTLRSIKQSNTHV